MSYDIYIGNAEVQVPDAEDLQDGTHLGVHVPHVERPDAPLFPNDEMTGRGNSRHPGYSQWSEFCTSTGLGDLFFGEKGLMSEHPGCFLLLPEHLDRVRDVLRKWESQHPDARPGWCSCAACEPWGPWQDKPFVPHIELDGNLARLRWLEWWMNWALENCEVPAIANH